MRERVFHVKPERVREVMLAVHEAVRRQACQGDLEIAVREPKRSLDQNAKLWPMLQDVADQVQWPVDGVLQLISKEDWKDLLTSGLKQEQRIAQGINGGFVMLGSRTSRMRKKEFSELIEFIYWFGSEKGVRWSEKALSIYEQYREAQ